MLILKAEGSSVNTVKGEKTWKRMKEKIIKNQNLPSMRIWMK